MDVCDSYRELLLLVSAGHCWGRRGLLQWMSVTVTENCYCWSVLVSAGVEEDCYSGCLSLLQSN